MKPFGVEFTSARSWTDVQMEGLFAEGFPEFIIGDKEVHKYHRRNWDQTRVEGPNCSGRKRHWQPVCEM